MSEIIKKLGLGGWFENKDPLCLNDKLEPVAPKHHEAAMQKKANEMKGWGKTNIIIPEEISPEQEIGCVYVSVPKVEIESTKKAIENFCLKYEIYGLLRHELSDLICIEIPISKVGCIFHYLANSPHINWNRMYCMNSRFEASRNNPHFRQSDKREMEEYDEEAERERNEEEYNQ